MSSAAGISRVALGDANHEDALRETTATAALSGTITLSGCLRERSERSPRKSKIFGMWRVAIHNSSADAVYPPVD